MFDALWTGRVNKLAIVGAFYAQAFRTIDGDFAWAVWKRNADFHHSDELIGKGRVATEAEAMQAAEQCLAWQPKEDGDADRK